MLSPTPSTNSLGTIHSSETPITSNQRNLCQTMSERCSGSDELICNYDTNRTKLYQMLEASDWDAVVARCQTDPMEAHTWIIRYKTQTNRVRWQLLPLHAAIIFESPSFVVSVLLETYPAAASQPDDQGMIPLHLAFRYYKHDDERILKELLRAHPEGINVKDNRGRVPIDLGRKHNRAHYSASFMHQYSVAFSMTAAWNNEKEMKRSVPLKFERASSPNPAQEDLDQVVSTMKSTHAKEIAALKGFYEERIQTMVSQTMDSLAKLQMDAEEVNQDLREQHHRDMVKMRELFSYLQKEKDATAGNLERLQKEIDDLKRALESARSEQGTDAQNDTLKCQIKNLHKDHETLQVLLRAQQEELATASEIRHEMVKTLMAQDKQDHAMAMQDSERLVTLAENIRVRMEHLSFIGAPLPPLHTKPRLTTVNKTCESRDDDHDDGDGISALTDSTVHSETK